MSDTSGAAAKAARSNRSRAACSACRQTKQKCDGPTRNPCRRCELYGLQCEYPPSSGPAPKPARAPGAQNFVPPPPFAIASGGADAGVMSERLKEISERLRSIEASLEHVHISATHSAGASPVSHPSLPHHHSSDGDSSSSHSHHPDAGHLAGVSTSNPMTAINETVEMVNKDQTTPETSNSNLNFDWLNGNGNMSNGVSQLFAGIARPDAVVRGVMSMQECEASFQIFFAKLSPWAMIFDQERDNNAGAMRERNPLLFHAILLSTSYYLMGTSERGSQVYYSLTGLVNELVAPQLISAQPHQVTTDFVRALMVLILWKPVQFASLYAQGITDPDHAEQASKLNTHAASILGGLMVRTAVAISLPSITNTFAKTFSPNISMPPQVLSDLRLWYWVCCVDTHSALTTGRAGAVNIAECLRTTRLFASLKAQPWDARLAATVELYATARFAATGNSAKSLTASELRKFNQDLDDHSEYWTPLLREAGQTDGLAYSVISIFSNFLRVVVNASIFTRWRSDRKVSLARGEPGRPPLSTEDWSFIQLGIDAAEKVIVSLSMESRNEGGIRTVRWPAKTAGQPRAQLTLDPVVVDVHRTAFDTIVCVVYVYPLILLAKMANAGLIRCELNCLEDEYNAGISLNRPQRLVNGAKLGRLLELGASFLEAIAPTSSHPARKHAKMLRTILAAGTLGQLAPIDPEGVVSYDSSNTPDRSSSASTSSSGHSFSAPLPPPGQFTLPTNAMAKGTPSLTEMGRTAGLASPEAGEALASILGGIQPNFFGGNADFFDGMDLGGNLDGNLAVDWDKLEQSLQRQLEAQSTSMNPGLEVAGGITTGFDYFSRAL